jgi:hypothetical protein
MSQPAATVTGPQLLQAQAKAVSARVKISPPWQVPCPLTMSLVTVMRVWAQPLPYSTTSMPSNRAAASAASIASTGMDGPAGCDINPPRSLFSERSVDNTLACLRRAHNRAGHGFPGVFLGTDDDPVAREALLARGKIHRCRDSPEEEVRIA